MLQLLGTYLYLPRTWYTGAEASSCPNPKPTNSVVWPPNVRSLLPPMPRSSASRGPICPGWLARGSSKKSHVAYTRHPHFLPAKTHRSLRRPIGSRKALFACSPHSAFTTSLPNLRAKYGWPSATRPGPPKFRLRQFDSFACPARRFSSGRPDIRYLAASSAFLRPPRPLLTALSSATRSDSTSPSRL